MDWIGEIFLVLAARSFGGIWAEKYAEKRKRRNQRLSELAPAVDSEIKCLDKKPDNLGGAFSITEWHLNSFSELTPFAENVKNFDKRRWKKIKGSWDKYRPPANELDSEHRDLQRYLLHGIDRESLMEKLKNLLKSIENAF